MNDFVIYIDDNWAVDEIETVEDCDDAFETLLYAIASIEYQLDMEAIQRTSLSEDDTWERRARAALRLKKSAFSLVQYKRGAIERVRRDMERKTTAEFFLRIVKRDQPEQFKRWMSEAGASAERASVDAEAA